MSEQVVEERRRRVGEGFGAGGEVGERHRSYTSPLVSEPETTQTVPAAPRDPADEAMCARARERFTGDRGSRFRRRRKRHAELPNLIIVGGLKCGTTSIHHYLGLHPEIHMSKPKELNFFVEELNWDLGLDWYASRFDAASRCAASPRPTTPTCPASRACRSGSGSTAPTPA